MSNPLKGAVDFKIGDESLTVSFSSLSIFRLEKHVGKNARKIGLQIADPDGCDMELLRVLLWTGLLDQKPEILLEDVDKYLRRISAVDVAKIVIPAFFGAVVNPDALGEAAPATGPQQPNQKE